MCSCWNLGLVRSITLMNSFHFPAFSDSSVSSCPPYAISLDKKLLIILQQHFHVFSIVSTTDYLPGSNMFLILAAGFFFLSFAAFPTSDRKEMIGACVMGFKSTIFFHRLCPRRKPNLYKRCITVARG